MAVTEHPRSRHAAHRGQRSFNVQKLLELGIHRVRCPTEEVGIHREDEILCLEFICVATDNAYTIGCGEQVEVAILNHAFPHFTRGHTTEICCGGARYIRQDPSQSKELVSNES